MPKTTRARTNSTHTKPRGFSSCSAAATINIDFIYLTLSSSDGPRAGARDGSGVGGLEDERQGDADDGERLGKGEAEDRDRLESALRLGLAGHAGDVGREDQADTDTRADSSQAVA